MVREEHLDEVEDRAERNAEERLLDLLLPPPPPPDEQSITRHRIEAIRATKLQRTREKLREQLREGKLDDRMVEIDVRERSCRRSKSSPTRASRRWTSTSRTCSPASSASAPRSAR